MARKEPQFVQITDRVNALYALDSAGQVWILDQNWAKVEAPRVPAGGKNESQFIQLTERAKKLYALDDAGQVWVMEWIADHWEWHPLDATRGGQ